MDKYRIQFDLTPEALESLDNIKNEAKANTRAEVIRNSLRYYRWYISKVNQGYKLLLRKNGETTEIEIIDF